MQVLAVKSEREAERPPECNQHDSLKMSREQVLIENMSLVRYVARRIHQRLPRHIDLDDLISAGTAGLIDAYNKFDQKKLVQFKSYARFRINGAILDSLRTLDWGPRSLRKKAREVEAAVRTLTHRFECSPTDQQIAEFLGVSLKEYHLLLRDLRGLEIGTLNSSRHEESGEEELAYIPGPEKDGPLFHAERSEFRRRLALAIDDLVEKERLVMTLYYQEERTMKEIGAMIGVVESRVSQIHNSAVIKLRVALSDYGTERKDFQSCPAELLRNARLKPNRDESACS